MLSDLEYKALFVDYINGLIESHPFPCPDPAFGPSEQNELEGAVLTSLHSAVDPSFGAYAVVLARADAIVGIRPSTDADKEATARRLAELGSAFDEGVRHNALFNDYMARCGHPGTFSGSTVVSPPDRHVLDLGHTIRCLKLAVFILTVLLVLLILSLIEYRSLATTLPDLRPGPGVSLDNTSERANDAHWYYGPI
jgi:hypothetical protein